MNQFLSMHYRLGLRQGWILPCMDQIGKIWCGSLEKITMVAVSRAGMRIRGARRSCRAFTRSASSEEACRSAANAHARHAATGGVSHRALKGEPRALASALRLPVRRADVFFLPLRGRAVLETVCDRFAFPGDRRALGKAAFARSPALPVLLRCRRAARIARAFLRIKNRKSGLARTNAFHYYISSRRGRGSAGRARPCQGRGRGFEPRRPLHRLREAGHT